ncbi:MAG: MCE family protein [Planctomycetes bacterium]|nr:MCE family protein [Planctomycetota bacterium]
MNARRQDIVLGVFFFAALIGLGIVTIVESDFAFGVERHDLVAYSDDVGYLRPGDPVLLFGMSAGKVASITRLDEPRLIIHPSTQPTVAGREVRCTVRLDLRLDVDPYEYLKADHRILIEDRGLLGGKLVRIETGVDDARLSRDAPLVALAAESAIQGLGGLIEENRQPLNEILNNVADVTAHVNRGEGPLGRLVRDDELADRLSETIDSVRDVTSGLAKGEGTLGRLLKDGQLYDDARVFMSDLRSAMERVKRGEGSLGRLLQEDGLYQRVDTILADAQGVMADVAAGKGSLGKLLHESGLYDDLHATVGDVLALVQDARDGKGTVGRLLVDESLFVEARDFFATAGRVGERIESIATDMQEGKGLLAALLSDEKLANDLRNILDQVLGAVEDARETAPVRSVGSLLFGTF